MLQIAAIIISSCYIGNGRSSQTHCIMGYSICALCIIKFAYWWLYISIWRVQMQKPLNAIWNFLL